MYINNNFEMEVSMETENDKWPILASGEDEGGDDNGDDCGDDAAGDSEGGDAD